jgi:4-hydroxy-3-methylbut-2-enyl diphosphate reductase
VNNHYKEFDTICDATQERQDAITDLLEEPLDFILVVGGYDSSNTCHLKEIPHMQGVTSYHINRCVPRALLQS